MGSLMALHRTIRLPIEEGKSMGRNTSAALGSQCTEPLENPMCL